MACSHSESPSQLTPLTGSSHPVAAHEDNALELPPGRVADACHLTPVEVWPTTLCEYETAGGASWHEIAEASAPNGVKLTRAAEAAPLPRMFRTSLMYHANGSAFGRRRTQSGEKPSGGRRGARAAASAAPSCARGWVTF